MEMLFRRIEYWIDGDANAQKRLTKAPWTTDKILKRVSKHAIFFGISFLIGNTFLAYIIGSDKLIEIITDPVSEHLAGFGGILIFSFVFYGVFAYMREQVCVTVCPYGRLQGVMLDQDSMVISYDFVRGEPRGKLRKPKKGQDESSMIDLPVLGDCIDCKLCVQVCPTGIDIRDGTQLECINCTACIDACDEVMVKINKPKGLIRYDTYNGIKNGVRKIFTPRVYAYSVVLILLLGLQTYLFTARGQVETLFLRTPGMLFQKTDDGMISNLYNYQIINKTDGPLPIELRLRNEQGRMRFIGAVPDSAGIKITEGAVFIDFPPEQLTDRKNQIIIEVWSGGEMVNEVKTNFLGPVK